MASGDVVRRATVVVLVLLVLTTSGYLTYEGIQRSERKLRAGEPCSEAQPPTDLPESVAFDPEAVPSVVELEQPQTRNFELERDPARLRTSLELSTPMDKGVERLNVRAGPIARPDGRALEPEMVTVEASIDQRGRRDSVWLTVCIDPVAARSSTGTPLIAKAGRYTGIVYLDDPRVTGGAVTYQVDLKYPNVYLVAAAVFIPGMIGAFAGLVLASGLTLATWTEHKGRALAAIVSLAGALSTVFVAQYLNDPSWQGDLRLFATLVVTSVAAAYAATNFAGTVSVESAKPAQRKAPNPPNPPNP
jgi:hypothetical protein